MIWIPALLASQIEYADILPASFADHNPVSIEVRSKRPRVRNCRMYPSDLENKEFVRKIKNEMKWFFQLNKTQDIEIQTVWDASKAF